MGRIIVHATVARVHAIDDGILKRSAVLDDSPAHRLDIVIRQRAPTHGPLHASGSPPSVGSLEHAEHGRIFF
jgi:hypothetical protein